MESKPRFRECRLRRLRHRNDSCPKNKTSSGPHHLLPVRVRTGREPPAQLFACRQRRPADAGQAHPLSARAGDARFRGHRTDLIETLEFARIKKLQLLRSRATAAEGTCEDAERRRRGATGSQIVKVSFKDGENLAAETRGFLVEMTGLYLYLTVEDGKIQRTFIPTHAYADIPSASPSARCLPRSRRIRWTSLRWPAVAAAPAHSAHRRLSYRQPDHLPSSEQVLKDRDQTLRKVSSVQVLVARRGHQQAVR